MQLSNALRDLGFDIDRKNIRILDDRIRSIGTYEAELSLHRNVQGRFLFEVVGQ